MIEKLFLGLISLVLNFTFLNYVDKLERVKCGCSKNWKRDYIKVYSIIVIMMVSAMMFLDLKEALKNKVLLNILSIVQLGGFLYIYCLYTFTKELKEDNCECSGGWERDFMYNYSMIIICLYLLTIIMNIGVIMFVASPRFEKVCRRVLSGKKSSSKNLK